MQRPYWVAPSIGVPVYTSPPSVSFFPKSLIRGIRPQAPSGPRWYEVSVRFTICATGSASPARRDWLWRDRHHHPTWQADRPLRRRNWITCSRDRETRRWSTFR